MGKLDIIQEDGFLKQLVKLPNILSMSRVLILPFVWYAVHLKTDGSRFTAAILILVMFITDLLDGYIAKKYNLQTKLGRILDHVCDKISVATVMLIVVVYFDFPLWVFLVVAVRDLINLLANSLFTLRSKEVLRPNYMGKLSFIILSITIVAYCTQWVSEAFFQTINPGINVLFILVVIFMVLSTLHYIGYYRKEWLKYSLKRD